MKPWQDTLNQRWAALAPREQSLLRLGAVVVGLGLLWFVGLQPAWRTWREVPAQRAALEVQSLNMQRMASEARELKDLPAVGAEQSALALKAATERLGPKAKLSLVADRATLQANGLAPAALAAWLEEVRSGARARPVELQLNHGADGLSGQVVLQLPGAAP